MPRTGLTANEVKDKAVEIAIAEMREVGFEKVRLSEIARTIGVSHAALYAHFADKAALLDAVSERWLLRIDEQLEAICRGRENPVKKIQSWFLKLHRLKAQKVLSDPKVYEAFDMAAQVGKPFVDRHLVTNLRQLTRLVEAAVAEKKIRKVPPEQTARILREAMASFTHPRLVAQFIGEKREDLLVKTLDALLRGLKA